MSENRPYVLTIAGFDPSGGAGVLADCKTFEQHRVYGFAIITANTIQTENEFFQIQWTDLSFVLQSLKKMFHVYEIKAVKIGIIPTLDYLDKIISTIKKLSPETKIIWDTVLKSSTDFDFLTIENQNLLNDILSKIDLITPNYIEMAKLGAPQENIEIMAQQLSQYCAVLLKGGHHPTAKGIDYLYTAERIFKLNPLQVVNYEKHGSGCVLSAAITANLALESNILLACNQAKKYIENYLLSNPTKLGYHYA